MQVELTDAVLPVQAEGVHCQLSNSEVGDLINKATHHLSEMQKVLFVLRDIECMEVDEVSEITGWSAKQINDNLFIARKKIRAQLKQMME
jgi:RNA polymerase sigma-70 factor (ECF subfamily)